MANEIVHDAVRNFGVPHTIVLGVRDPASLQTRFVVRCTECRDEEVVVVTQDDMELVRNNDDAIKAVLALRDRLKEAAELHRRLVHQPMTYDAARALMARAVRENFPDRADEILRAIEKGDGTAAAAREQRLSRTGLASPPWILGGGGAGGTGG
jgi:hypothetical protein